MPQSLTRALNHFLPPSLSSLLPSLSPSPLPPSLPLSPSLLPALLPSLPPPPYFPPSLTITHSIVQSFGHWLIVSFIRLHQKTPRMSKSAVCRTSWRRSRDDQRTGNTDCDWFGQRRCSWKSNSFYKDQSCVEGLRVVIAVLLGEEQSGITGKNVITIFNHHHHQSPSYPRNSILASAVAMWATWSLLSNLYISLSYGPRFRLVALKFRRRSGRIVVNL